MSKKNIREHMDKGSIVISPFEPGNLGSTSHDVRLGPYFFREQRDRGGSKIFNPFDPDHVKKYWGEPQYAISASQWMSQNQRLTNITDEDWLIVVEAGETILAHTIEFVGGRSVELEVTPLDVLTATSEMRARSTIGRVGITVCKCAGWGDVGFVNRWTMEITNHLDSAALTLPVGMRIAQIAFYEVESDVGEETYAERGGKYQSADDIEQVRAAWTPYDILPKLFLDRDVRHFHEFITDDLKAA
ncbi:hypothetical protein ACFL04_00495 [Patescibacteria group bacterium]